MAQTALGVMDENNRKIRAKTFSSDRMEKIVQVEKELIKAKANLKSLLVERKLFENEILQRSEIVDSLETNDRNRKKSSTRSL